MSRPTFSGLTGFACLWSSLLVVVLLSTVLSATEAKRVCNANQMRCRDGRRCVSGLDVCDLEAHCQDRSDENENFCNGNLTGLTRSVINTNQCKPGMYRCRFGGCVEATKLCNNNIDCFDGSDETTDLCKTNRCRGKRFRCNYGGCVKSSELCNGKPGCIDYSDETFKACKGKVCSEGYFQCKYGACIPVSKVCDGKKDCFDKSDERSELCKVIASAENNNVTEMPGFTLFPK